MVCILLTARQSFFLNLKAQEYKDLHFFSCYHLPLLDEALYTMAHDGLPLKSNKSPKSNHMPLTLNRGP
jgi:hypothetical protein